MTENMGCLFFFSYFEQTLHIMWLLWPGLIVNKYFSFVTASLHVKMLS